MNRIRDFLFGTFYLTSGIYSLGFSLMLIDTTRPLNGNPAFFVVPDALFPIEVTLFAVFGICFIASAAYHFLRSIQTARLSTLGAQL